MSARYLQCLCPALLTLLPFGSACGGKAEDSTKPGEESPEATASATEQPSTAISDEKKLVLLDPEAANEKAPDKFLVRFDTGTGDIVFDITRAWAPLGADRFYNLVKIGFFTDVSFFRAVEGFMIQFGIHGDPEVSSAWASANLEVDPPRKPNYLGYLSFAMAGSPDTRSTQLFINLRDNPSLDETGFAPIGRVKSGMAIVHKIYTGYGDAPPQGSGPDQGLLRDQGNTYLKRDFPLLHYIKSASLIDG